MIEYVSLYIDDIDMAASFYDALLPTLDYRQYDRYDNVISYGKNSIDFVAIQRPDIHELKINSTHVAFIATSIKQVDNFFQVANHHSGAHKLAPSRQGYPQGDVYTACVYDPFGNELEALFKITTHD